MSPPFGRAFDAANVPVNVVLDRNVHRDDQVPHFNLASFAASALVVLDTVVWCRQDKLVSGVERWE